MLKEKLIAILIMVVTLQFILLRTAFAYLDPGAGSYLYQILAASIIGVLFALKTYWQRIKTFFSRLSTRNRKDGFGN